MNFYTIFELCFLLKFFKRGHDYPVTGRGHDHPKYGKWVKFLALVQQERNCELCVIARRAWWPKAASTAIEFHNSTSQWLSIKLWSSIVLSINEFPLPRIGKTKTTLSKSYLHASTYFTLNSHGPLRLKKTKSPVIFLSALKLSSRTSKSQSLYWCILSQILYTSITWYTFTILFTFTSLYTSVTWSAFTILFTS